MGKGIIDELKKEFPIEDEWLPFEIHPDTPEKGVLWKDYFPGMDPMAFWNQLNPRAATMGIHFGPQTLMSNSSKAMQAGEFAKKFKRYGAFHEAVFQAFFTDCKDIGDTAVILGIAEGVGLDPQILKKELEAGTYIPILEQTTTGARKRMITSAPTFIIDGHTSITGAEPIEKFRTTLKELSENKVKI